MNPTTSLTSWPEMLWIPSPNHYEGRGGIDVDTLVIHYTAGKGNARAAALAFADSDRDASAHFTIGRPAHDVVQCVDLDDGAWHAGDGGRSRIPTPEQLAALDFVPLAEVPPLPKNLNRRSVGVELCNCGFAEGGPNPYVHAKHRNPASHAMSWESYTNAQIESLLSLIPPLRAKFPALQYVTAHEDVCHKDTLGAVGGKLDVGPLFPWETLRVTGLRRVSYDFKAHGWRVDAPNGAA